MAELANLGYAVFGVSDLALWKEFAGVLGFLEGAEAPHSELKRPTSERSGNRGR